VENAANPPSGDGSYISDAIHGEMSSKWRSPASSHQTHITMQNLLEGNARRKSWFKSGPFRSRHPADILKNQVVFHCSNKR
jgi:hypothetical protein